MLEIPLSGIKKIEEIARSSNEYISLSQGSIKLGGIPQQIKDYVQTLMKTDKTDYYESCWGLKLLREKLAHTLSAQYKTTITVDQVLPTHGCIGGLSLLYLTILSPGDEVIIPEPSYPAYHLLAQASRSNPIFVSCFKQGADGSSAWEIDVEKIKVATTPRTKMIIFSNPSNPLGVVVPKTTILQLLAWCEEKGIFLVIDEAYRDYVFEGDYESALPLINSSQWLISANTFSKNMAMSGWRIGYLIMPPRLNKALAGMQDVLLNCLNNTAQFAAIYALDHQELTKHLHNIILKNRDMMMDRLQPLIANKIIMLNRPQGGIFSFLQTDQADATELCMSILYKAKVSMVPGSSFGPSGKQFMRLCFARDTEILEEGIDRIVKFFI